MKAINRLYKYLEYKGIKPTRFEKDINLSNGYLGTQLKRGADLGESIINKIIDNSLDLNAEWLLTGSGSMLKTHSGGDNNHINNSTGSAIVTGGGGISVGRSNIRGVSRQQVSEPATGYDNRPAAPVTPDVSGDVEIEKLRALLAEKDALLAQKDIIIKAKDDIIKAKDDIIQLLMSQLSAK
ncbi:hypothetical protein FACS1894169_14400 [Bacteroidia bacterium]|nr:hypothetical protein FACS1894169_14400 [Bacteroidia bacterium]